MTKYFLVSGLLLCLITSCATVPTVQQSRTNLPEANARVWTEALRSEDRKNSYQVTIRIKDKQISGICLLKKVGDEWRGSLVNEFGAKAFDFIVTSRKCELQNVVSLMDKWYIRKTIASDLYSLFEVDNLKASFRKKKVCCEQDALVVRFGKKRVVTRLPDETLTMQNLVRHISYSLVRMEE
ncbi:MAG: hypothetical protein LBB90_08415 [Tannerella sp.]|jgi:hypothetical protein|nr:hypothetical protein [Tannerella sp.]